MIHLWLAGDPETFRVTAQPWEWSDGDFPPGARGLGWPRREIDVDADAWASVLAAQVSPEEQDDLIRAWWNEAAPDGPPWPEITRRI